MLHVIVKYNDEPVERIAATIGKESTLLPTLMSWFEHGFETEGTHLEYIRLVPTLKTRNT